MLYTFTWNERKGALRRFLALALIFTAVVAVFFAWRPGQQPVRALAAPELRSAPEIFETGSRQGGAALERGVPEIRLGSFKRPEGVPDYAVLEEDTRVRNGARGLWLLVDTRARGEAAYTLIVRDIKARYRDYDAVSLEFTDSSETLDYKGAGLIFNTPAGAYYIGFVYGPPNNRGYLVDAAG